jgi:hypothetical protein
MGIHYLDERVFGIIKQNSQKLSKQNGGLMIVISGSPFLRVVICEVEVFSRQTSPVKTVNP